MPRARFFQSIFFGKFHRWELFVAMRKLLSASRVFDQREITLPIPVGELMKVHFNFNAFVDRLNHWFFSVVKFQWRGRKALDISHRSQTVASYLSTLHDPWQTFAKIVLDPHPG